MPDSLAGPQPWRGINVLVVSPTPTHPQDHGNRKRIHEICAALKRLGAAIHFVHYPSEHDWRDAWPIRHENEMRAAWDSYQLVPPSRSLHHDALGLDHGIDEWSDPALEHYLAWVCRARSYDMAIVNYTWMSFCFRAMPPNIFKVCDTHDVFGGRRQMLQANGLAPEFFHTTTEDEGRGLARADLVWAIKASEQIHFEKELKLLDCLTMLHAEPRRRWWIEPPSTDGWLRAGVIGARNNVNRRNLENFLQVALPLLYGYMAPVKIVIAGSCSSDFAGLSHPNVEILGRVDDVEEFYRGVDVVIAPMEFSTGLKIKVSEALASGAPLIAHAHAMEGYPTDEPLHLLESFEEMTVELAKLAFERSPLPRLAARSTSVCAEIQASAEAALEATRRRLLAKFAGMICVIIPMEAFDPVSLFHDHLIAALDYLRFTAGLAIYVTGDPAKIAPDLLQRLNLANQVFADPALMAKLGDKAPDFWLAAELSDFLEMRGFERAYVMTDCCDRFQFSAGRLRQVFIRHDMIEIAGGDADALVDYFRASAEVFVIGASPAPIMRWEAVSGVTGVIHAPFRRSGVFESLARRAKSAKKPGALLILAKPVDPLAQALAEMANRLGVDADILDPADPATASTLLRPSEAPSAADPLSGFADLRLVVDMTTRGNLATVIGEAAMRLGIPRLAFHRGAMAVGLHPFASALNPTSVARLFTTVAECLVDGERFMAIRDEAAREASARFDADAGWAILWRLLTKPRAAAGEAAPDAAAELLWG